MILFENNFIRGDEFKTKDHFGENVEHLEPMVSAVFIVP